MPPDHCHARCHCMPWKPSHWNGVKWSRLHWVPRPVAARHWAQNIRLWLMIHTFIGEIPEQVGKERKLLTATILHAYQMHILWPMKVFFSVPSYGIKYGQMELWNVLEHQESIVHISVEGISTATADSHAYFSSPRFQWRWHLMGWCHGTKTQIMWNWKQERAFTTPLICVRNMFGNKYIKS